MTVVLSLNLYIGVPARRACTGTPARASRVPPSPTVPLILQSVVSVLLVRPPDPGQLGVTVSLVSTKREKCVWSVRVTPSVREEVPLVLTVRQKVPRLLITLSARARMVR